MIIAIDIGNTTASVGLIVKKGNAFSVLKRIYIPTNTEESGEDLASLIAEELGIVGFEAEGVVMSSVVPRLAEKLALAAETLTGRKPLMITRENAKGLIFKDIDMTTIGHDRLVDAAYAASIVPLPAVTVDMGTATTFNVVGEGGVFLGGVIAAGLQTGLWALHARTAQLPELMPEPTDCLIGKNTKACMESGALFGQAAMIDGIVERVEETLGRPVSLVVTGGWSEEVHKKLTHSYLYEPELMLKGLAYQWEMAGEGQKLSHNVQV